MKYRIRSQQDVAAGVIYVLAGAGFGLGALNYNIGGAARMGPGYFPLAIGLLLVAVGLLTILSGIRPRATEARLRRPQPGPLLWVLGAVVLFGLLLQPAGLVLALAALVIVSSLASHEFTWRATLVATVVLILFSAGVFIYGIQLQIPLWPTFLR